MSKTFAFVLTVVSFLVVGVWTVPPPIWPETFSQSFFIQFNDTTSTITTGKYWYDSTYGAQRYDFIDGKTKFACGAIYPDATSCTLLTTNQTVYIILPEKNLCCNGGPADIVDRNWLQNYTYVGESPIDGQGFYQWQELVGYGPNYFSDTSAKRIPRRFSFKRTVVMDFLPTTYSEDPIMKSVFSVPTYCQKDCTQVIREQQSEAETKSRIEGIRKWTRIFKKPTQSILKAKNLLREQ